MTPERSLHDTYADLLGRDADPRRARLVADLDMLYAAPVPADLHTAFNRLLAERSRATMTAARPAADGISRPATAASLPQPADTPAMPLAPRRGWLRQGLGFAGAALAIALVAALLVAVFRGSGDDRPAVQPAAVPAGVHEILYTGSLEGQGFAIFAVRSDGSGQRVVVAGNGATLSGPAWSPDGSQVAFARRWSSQSEIVVVNADGSDERIVATADLDDLVRPIWLAGGARIGFERRDDVLPVMHGILVVNVDGSDERVVIEAESIEQVAWSPDGARVSFVDRDRLYIATSDGSDRRVLTDVVMGTTTSWSPDGARIALQGDDGDIHVIDIASGVDQPITSGPGRDASPRWSPAGDEIVFVRGSDVGATLWIASADGTRERALTTPREPGVDGWTAADFSPVWSPDGRQVAYLLDDNPSSGFLLPEDDDQASLAVIDSDGANQRVVAEDVSARDEPVWSPVQVSDLDQFTTPLPVTPPPTTDQIAFASNRDGNAEIYLVNADGSGLTRLTDNPSSDTSPTWAPDGSQLAFVSDRAAEPDLYDLYVMDADGTNVVRLTEGARAAVPVWSPDGEWIAFTDATDDGLLDIFIVRPDGSDLTRLTDWPGIDTFPSWSQDGGGLVYQSDSGTGANDDIIYTSVDGTNTGAFTTDPRSQREPDWSPDGVRVAFASGSIERRMGHGVAIFDTIAVATINAADPAGRLTDTGLMGSTPRWSPDATWLAFRAPQLDPDGITATGELLMVMRPDGTGAQQLFGPVDETSLDYAWSPDSNRLAVTASTEDYDGLALYAVSLDGSEPLLLAEDVERLSRPAWRPTRRSPIFVPTPTVAPAPKPTIALTPTPSEPEAALDTAIAALPEGERGCTVTPARDTSPGGMEVQGKVLLGEGELWANYFSQGDVDDDRMIAGQSGTIYWSLETSFADTLRVVAVDPASGERVLPSWGPVAGSSPWRAGSVWRTFFTFPHAGCWELRVVRGESAGVLWLEVVAPSAQPSPTSGARVPAAVDAMRPL